MQFEIVGTQTQLLSAGEVRTHLGRASDDTASIPTADADTWIAQAAIDCYSQCGYLPESTAVKVYWDFFPRGDSLRLLGGVVDLGETVTLNYYSEATPTTPTAWDAANYQVINSGNLATVWRRRNVSWPSTILRRASAVELVCELGAPSTVKEALRRAMLLKIGTWAANPAEEDEPLVPGAQLQKAEETAARIYNSISIIPPGFVSPQAMHGAR